MVCAKWLTGAGDHGGKRVERAKRDQQKRTAAAANLTDWFCRKLTIKWQDKFCKLVLAATTVESSGDDNPGCSPKLHGELTLAPLQDGAVVRSYGGQWGSQLTQMNGPEVLSVDRVQDTQPPASSDTYIPTLVSQRPSLIDYHRQPWHNRLLKSQRSLDYIMAWLRKSRVAKMSNIIKVWLAINKVYGYWY